MRDTGDMMEDTFFEDTMMECNGDDASLDDLVDLTDDISNSAPTIRDAAERLLTLLGVENEDNDDDNVSSEDEGVELDESDENDEDEESDQLTETKNTRLLHQLAISLAQELKYSQKHVNSKSSTRMGTIQRGTKLINHEMNRARSNDQTQCMDVTQDTCYQEDAKDWKYLHQIEQSSSYKNSPSRGFYDSSNFNKNDSTSSKKYASETRLAESTISLRQEEKPILAINSDITETWAIGWDTCAAEAVRYLIEDEGLSPQHPTVIAMKCHLEIQKERAFSRFSV